MEKISMSFVSNTRKGLIFVVAAHNKVTKK